MYSRTLGVIILNDEVFNTKLLAQGLASRCFINNDCLNFSEWESIEVEARKQRLGLWTNIGRKGIVINELHPNPKGIDEVQEFVELYNTTNQPIDMSSWSFGIDEDTVFASRITISPYGYLILTTAQNLRDIHPEIADTVPIIRVTMDKYGNYRLLSNTAIPPQNLVVHLKDAEHGYQDSVTYNLNWDKKGAENTGYTMERISPVRINVGDSRVGGMDDENWDTSTVLNGTPGRFNSIGTIAVIYLKIVLTDSPMIGKATAAYIHAMDGNNQPLTNYQGTITIEIGGVVIPCVMMKNGVATASISFSQLGKIKITAKDTKWDNRCGMIEYSPELLGDFGQNGTKIPDNLINFHDLMWFSYYWNNKDLKADLGSAKYVGTVPTLISPLDGKVDFHDLMIFTSMWNWWNKK
jgi:hypothetical protein